MIQQRYEGRLDALIVLGAGREIHLSYMRAREAARFYNNGGTGIVLASGGRGLLCKTKKESEAMDMYKTLLEMGVKPEDIVLEKNSVNTYANFACSKQLLAERCVKTLGVVTNYSHMPRALKIGDEVMARSPKLECLMVPVCAKIESVRDLVGEVECFLYEFAFKRPSDSVKGLFRKRK